MRSISKIEIKVEKFSADLKVIKEDLENISFDDTYNSIQCDNLQELLEEAKDSIDKSLLHLESLKLQYWKNNNL